MGNLQADKVDWPCGSGHQIRNSYDSRRGSSGSKGLTARIDAVKTIYPVNGVLTNVGFLNILSPLVKLGKLSS